MANEAEWKECFDLFDKASAHRTGLKQSADVATGCHWYVFHFQGVKLPWAHSHMFSRIQMARSRPLGQICDLCMAGRVTR